MRISDMSSKKAFECMARIAPLMAKIESDPAVIEAKSAIKQRKPNEDVPTGEIIEKIMPVLLGKHQDAVFDIIAAVEGKTAKEIEEQPFAETIKAFNEIGKDFFDFLLLSYRLVLNA